MIPTDLHAFLRTRRSVRRFRPERVPDRAVEQILTSATYAPSAHNRQPWRFCVIADQEVKQCLADELAADFRCDLENDGVSEDMISAQIARSRTRITSAPLVIIVSVDLSEMDRYPDSRRSGAERTMALQSVAAAGTQLLLAAHAEGLGGVWVCSPLFAPEAVRKALKVPTAWEPQAMFFIGYPEDAPQAKERKPLKDIAVFLPEKIPSNRP